MHKTSKLLGFIGFNSFSPFYAVSVFLRFLYGKTPATWDVSLLRRFFSFQLFLAAPPVYFSGDQSRASKFFIFSAVFRMSPQAGATELLRPQFSMVLPYFSTSLLLRQKSPQHRMFPELTGCFRVFKLFLLAPPARFSGDQTGTSKFFIFCDTDRADTLQPLRATPLAAPPYSSVCFFI
jgi:hypothetical protein